MTSVAMRDYAHADVMWGVGADTSTRIDSDTRCPTMGQALIERSDLDTLVHSWHIDGILLQREQGSLTPIGPILRDIEQFVVAYFSAQLRQGMGRQFTDADFGEDPVLAKLDELATPASWMGVWKREGHAPARVANGPCDLSRPRPIPTPGRCVSLCRWVPASGILRRSAVC